MFTDEAAIKMFNVCDYGTQMIITAFLKARCHSLSDAILGRNNITIMLFDRYLSCSETKIQITLTNVSQLKIYS